MTETLWRVDSADTTLLLTARNTTDVPSIVWFGDLLPENACKDSAMIAALTDLPLPMAKLDASVSLSLFPQRSSGIDCMPALKGHFDGRFFDHHLYRDSVELDDQEVRIVLKDTAAQLEVILQLALHRTTGVLSITTTLINHADSTYNVDWLASASMPLPGSYRECLHLHGRWGLEFQQQRTVISPGTLMLHSHRGRTSHERYPGVMVGAAGFNENTGDVMAANLAWSGSHASTIELLSDGRLCYQSGVSLDPGECRLESGESLQTPVCYFKRHTCGGLNQVSHALHQTMRAEILPAWTRTERPVHANSWEALYFNHDIDTLKSLIDAAAEVGAERFILDDGWFVARRSDNAGLGDWVVDSNIYPDGLHPVVEHVRSRGMQFGLWFEPEMINPDSDLYRDHPDWVLHLKPHATPLARNQLVLNLDLPQVFDYLYQHIAALVREYRIDYIKWDHNRDLIMAGDGVRSRLMQQTRACYCLMQKLTTEFTELEIESCSSGGARADWGVLSYTGRVWTSDSIDAIDRVQIQRGYSYFNPPEIMGAHVGHAEAHLTGREINIHTRAIVALQGQYGYEIDARKLDDDEKQTLLGYVSFYKANRSWLSSSRTWRLDSAVDNLVCSGLVSEDQCISWWFSVAQASLSQTVAGNMVLCGLNPAVDYQVRLASSNLHQLRTFSKKVPDWLTSGAVVNGAVLMTIGLSLPVMPAQSALLIEVKC